MNLTPLQEKFLEHFDSGGTHYVWGVINPCHRFEDVIKQYGGEKLAELQTLNGTKYDLIQVFKMPDFDDPEQEGCFRGIRYLG